MPLLRLFAALCAVLPLCAATAGPFATCRGQARYAVSFHNALSPAFFGDLIPADGLVFSPLTAVSHSNRVSLLTVRGFASPEIEAVAETGDNAGLLRLARSLRGNGTRSVVVADGATLPANTTTLRVAVDCRNPFVSAVAMIAPSPDWIVQVSNLNLYDSRRRAFKSFAAGFLIAYDAGTDSGRDFTDPSDPALDQPTVPPQNIAPLVEDETDRFEGRVVGKYFIKRIA